MSMAIFNNVCLPEGVLIWDNPTKGHLLKRMTEVSFPFAGMCSQEIHNVYSLVSSNVAIGNPLSMGDFIGKSPISMLDFPASHV